MNVNLDLYFNKNIYKLKIPISFQFNIPIDNIYDCMDICELEFNNVIFESDIKKCWKCSY